MTDEELDALVTRLDDMSDISRDHAAGLLDLGHKVAVNQAITAITTLRAQLAEARAERDFTVSDGQRLLRKQDILSVCDTPDLCFVEDDGAARCGPCAVKLAKCAGVILNRYTISNPEAMRLRRELTTANARADRAEAALAAQIEAIIAKIDDTADAALEAGLDDRRDGLRDALNIIRNQPHDRTALDRMLAETREKALREAAEILDDEGWLGMSMHRIRALIEKEKTE